MYNMYNADLGTFRNHYDAIKIAEDKAIKKLYTEAIYSHLCDNWEVEFENMKDFMEYSKYWNMLRNYLTKKKGGKWKYIFVVINFMDGIGLDAILKKKDKILKKKWIKDWMWSMEQRGKNINELGKGLHLNMVLEVDEDKYVYGCKREIFNSVKFVVGNKRHVCIRYANCNKNFVNYIMGIKKDKKKDNLIHMDKLWRTKNKLKDYYMKGEVTKQTKTQI